MMGYYPMQRIRASDTQMWEDPPRTEENGTWIKTKTPVLVVRTTNEIRETPSLLSDADRGFTPAAPSS